MTRKSAAPFAETRSCAATDSLPAGLRLLCVGPHQPSWVHLALQLDAKGCSDPQFHWVSTSGEALAQLRDEGFDCVIICSHAVDADADSLALLAAIRASGCDDPVVLLLPQASDADWARLCSLDCEVLVSPQLWDSAALAPMIQRAIGRVETLRESHRLALRQRRRHLRERDEAEHLLRQQRQMLSELEGLPDEPAANSSSETPEFAHRPKIPLPPQVAQYYHELLRTYVIMGSGNLGREIQELARLIALAELTPREALALHVERVEALVRGLGNRSCRHVMLRADLLALELMMHLGECYQRRVLRDAG